MRFFLSFVLISCFFSAIEASSYQNLKLYSRNQLTADDSKIKACLKSLYASQIQFRKTNGYFTAVADQLKLNRYQVCDGLQISTHMVTENKFKMTAKFNHRIWSVDEGKKIQPQTQSQD